MVVQWDEYGTHLSDAERVLTAASQLLLGHRHYGARLPDSNAVNLAELIYEGARRLVLAEGNGRGIAAPHPDPQAFAAQEGRT